MNTIKKIMYAFFGVAIFVVPSISFAATFANDSSLGFPTLSVANNTTSPAGCTSCWSTSASANAGEEVSFEIYYHNAGPDTANNVRVKLTPQTTGTGTNHSFTATVSADNAPTIYGSASVSLSSSQALSYISGMTSWYPDNNNPTVSSALLSGQSGAELFNGTGLNLGNIIPGWSRQGTVIVTFKVSSTQENNGTAPYVVTNSATNITQSAAQLNGNANPNGAYTTAWFEWGTTSSLGTTIPSQSIGGGTNAQNITANIWNLLPNTTYYFRANATNPQGTTRGSVLSFTTSGTSPTVTLPTITTNNATSIYQNTATLNGYVNPNGTSDTTRWFEWGTSYSNLNNQTTRYSHGTNADGFAMNISGLSQNTTYYFRAVAQNSQGTVQGQTLSFTTNNNGNGGGQNQATVTTQSASNISNDFAVLNGYVDPNGSSDTTRWFEWGANSSSNMYSQTSHYNQGSIAGSFSSSLSGLSQGTTYYYRAVAQNGQGIVYGNTISFTLGNNCNNNWYGNNCGNNNIATVSTRNADTSGTYAVLNGYADPNGTGDTVHWFEWGSTYSLGQTTQYVAQGNSASSFSASVVGLSGNTTYYYRAVARNSMGTVYGSTLSFTTTLQGSYTNGVAPTVTTLLATNISGNSAVLNGLVFNSGNVSANAWYEWGTNADTMNRTQTSVVGALPVARYADTISGLASGQTYYYRIVAENTYGKVYGSILNFTAGNTVTTNNDTNVVITSPVQTTRTVTVINRGTGTESLVLLTIDGGDETIFKGEKRAYHVVWENKSAQTLRNVVLRVTFPSSMKVESATRGSYSSIDNAVVVDVRTLAPGEKGETFIFATGSDDLTVGQLLVVTANMVYTKANGVQGDAIAYVTHRVGEGTFTNGLGASIFGVGPFLPTTLLGWMILLILVLGLVLLGNHVYGRFGKD